MIYHQQNLLFIFGASKLTRGGLVKALIKEHKMIVVVRHQINKDDPKIRAVFINGVFLYNEVIISEDEYNADSLPKDNHYLGKPCVYIIDFKTFQKVARKGKYIQAISLCRDGIFMYVNSLADSDLRADIVSFDNDGELAKEANRISKNITVVKGVAHHIVSDVDDHKDKKKILVTADTEPPIFIFPPGMKQAFNLSPTNLMCIQTDSNADFKRYVKLKLFFINMPHTLMGIFAYISHGISKKTEKASFNQLDDYEMIKAKALYIINDVIKSNGNDLSEDDKKYWLQLYLSFMSYIDTHSTETVGRALGFNNASKDKLETHYKYYKKFNKEIDKFVLEYINKFD